MQVHHEYRVNAFGAGGRNGVVHAEGVLPCISFSAPPEFLGEPGRWTPEHFLVAAVAARANRVSPAARLFIRSSLVWLESALHRGWRRENPGFCAMRGGFFSARYDCRLGTGSRRAASC